ncbi:MAG: hypothetical protein AAFO94_22570 [Bacteroidota bacterium]
MMPYDFILDYLYPLPVRTKKMFGNTSIYIGDKIYLATRKSDKNPLDNGIWIGTALEHHDSLKAQFPSIGHLRIYKIKKWLLLPADAEDFEEVAISLCDLIKQEDPRLGVVPAPRKKKRS